MKVDTTQYDFIQSLEYDPDTDAVTVQLVAQLADVRFGREMETELSAALLDLTNTARRMREGQL